MGITSNLAFLSSILSGPANTESSVSPLQAVKSSSESRKDTLMKKSFLAFGIGLLFLVISFRQVIVSGQSHFYTEFTLGSWLILDALDYMISGSSILTYLLKNKRAAIAFFCTASVFFFTIDFFIGVRILHMWEWLDYSPLDYLQMFAVMNPAFVVSVYELYQLVSHLVNRTMKDEQKRQTPTRMPYMFLLCVGILFLIAPVGFLFFHLNWLFGYSLFLSFSSITLICDAIIFLAQGIPLTHDILFPRKTTIISLIITVYTALLMTEGLNLFGHEWRYTRMPFMEWHIFSVPLAVFVGWIPLVMGAISLVTMIKALFSKA